MANLPSHSVKLDINNPEFLKSLLELDKNERGRVLATLQKLLKLSWDPVYKDQGLEWEKISSVRLPAGIDAVYSLRITQARRASAMRDGEFMRFLKVYPDHDSTYGKT